jgi:hypothetical protein
LNENVDGRDEPGHDEERQSISRGRLRTKIE